MSLMQQIQRGKVNAPRRTLLFGVHGVGKSTFASMADAPVFIPVEDGLSNIDCAHFPLATKYAEVIQALGALYTEEHEYRTIVIDSVDWLERLIFADVCRQRGVESVEDVSFGKAYVFALTQWRDVLAGLDALRNERGMAVILIAHAQIERFNNPECESYDRYSPRLHKQASALLQEWADEVLFATYKVYTKSTDAGFGRQRVQGIGQGERILRTSERPAHVAKNRLGLPDELPLDYRIFAAYVRGEPPMTRPEEPTMQGA